LFEQNKKSDSYFYI